MRLLEDILKQLQEFAPNLIFALVILFIGWIIAKLVASIVKRILKAIKIDDLADKLNDIDIVRQTNMKILPSNVISKVVYYVFMLITFVVATDKLGVEAVTNLLTDFIGYLPKLLTGLIFFILGLVVADTIRGVVLTACQSLGIPSAKIIASVVFYFIFLSVTMSALDQAGIQTDFIKSNLMIIIAGVVGAFAFGYGLASKGMMSNLLASFYAKGKFIIGDTITVEGIKGQIVAMDNTSVTVQTDTSKTVFPLSKLT
ncbi:MAG: mechanosensitive ion channel domain-containing protein, partial [Saprospiraceae bacterium]